MRLAFFSVPVLGSSLWSGGEQPWSFRCVGRAVDAVATARRELIFLLRSQ